MAKYYSDRQLDAAGSKLREMAREKLAQRRRDEQKLNDAREGALRFAREREKRSYK
ncbi:MAG: hypothetical protein ACM35H_14180 [Bacteroidota bacterium]